MMEPARTERSWRPLAVIAGVLVVYALGSKIPLPGLDVERLAAMPMQGAMSRLSVMALGLMPFLSVLIFFEIAKLAIPPFAQRQARSPAMAYRLLFIFVVVLATMQAYGVVSALAGAGLLQADDNATMLAVIAALVGGTLLLVWLADRIDLPGIGNGFWLVWVAPFLGGFATLAATVVAAMQVGALGLGGVLIGLAYILLGSAAVVLANRVIVRGDYGVEPIALQALIWPPLLANVVAGYIAAFFYLVFSLSPRALAVIQLILLVPLIALFVYAYMRQSMRAEAAPGYAVRAAPWVLLCLLELVVCVGGELLSEFLVLPWRFSGALLIITVTVMMSLLRLLPFRASA